LVADEIGSQKNFQQFMKRIFFTFAKASALFAALAALPAFAQNCALCYTQAASSGQRMIEALRSGILILIVPPTLMSVAMIFVVHHKRNQFRQPDYAAPKDGEWQQLR
jgi:ABC-type Fe3+ transport system permease subunit